MSKARRRVGMQAVADHVGVSIATVSNALNRPAMVSDAVRARVEEAVKELGYVPNAAARSLRTGVTSSMGALFFDIANPFFSRVTRAMSNVANERGHVLTVLSTDQDPERETEGLRFLVEHGVRAVVVTTAMDDLDHLVEVQRQGVAVLLLAQQSDRPQIGSIALDDAGGMRAVVEHLLDRGARHLGFVDGPGAARQHVVRLRAVRETLARAGLDPERHLTTVVAPTADPVGGREATTRLLEQTRGRLDAVVGVNDFTALGAFQALQDAGLAVPDDVLLTGFDDIGFASLLAVPLTTVHQPLDELGALAVDAVLDMSQGRRAEPVHRTLPATLVARASTDRPTTAPENEVSAS